MTVKCPICRKSVELGSEAFPFCSERCRTIDLGAWANEEYRIPVPGSAPVETKSPDEAEDEE